MKNALFVFLLYMLIPWFGNSQTTTHIASDSLAKYSFEQIDKKFESIRKANSEVAEIYLNALQGKANNKKEKITVFLKMAHYEIFHGTYEKAFLHIEAAYELAKNEESIELGYVYEKKGFYYYKRQDYDKALRYYLKALPIAEEKKDNRLLIKIEHKLGAIHNNLKAYKKALKAYLLAYKKIEIDTVDYDVRISIIKSLANIYLRKYSGNKAQKKLLDSFYFFKQKGLKLATPENDQKTIAYLEYLSGISFFTREKYASALTHFNKSLKAREFIKVNQMVLANYFYKGKTFLQLKQADSAIYYLKKSEPSLKDTSKKLNETSTYALLSECYQQKGDLQSALEYAKLANAYTERITKNNEQTKAFIDQKYTLPKLQKRIQNLEMTLENTNQKKIGWYIFSLVLLALLFLGYVFFRRREQKNKAAFQKLLEDTKENQSNSIKKVIPEEQTQQILDALEKFEADDLLFLRQDCTLSFLAKKLNTNTAYLSNIINEYKNQSYTNYIKKLRIDYSIKRLKTDARFRAYTIESVAKECGFKTAKSFSRAFKNSTNIYPSTFIKSLQKMDQQ